MAVDPQKLLDDTLNTWSTGNNGVGAAGVLWYGGQAYWSNIGCNSEGGVAVSNMSVFELLSVQKVFTGLLFATQLVGDSPAMQLRCVPVSKYLNVSGDFIEQVQPWMLATHTAGFPFNIAHAPAQNLYAGEPPSQNLINWWENFKPDSLLGCKEVYSDLGVLSLGFATVAASGQLYPDLLTSQITTPWQMNNTYLTTDDVPDDQRVTGYQNGKATQPTLGVRSCTADLLQFLKGHLGLISTTPQPLQEAVQQVLTPLYWRDGKNGIGICWQIKANASDPSLTVFEKDGGGDGFSTWVALVPGQSTAFAFLANNNPVSEHWGKLSQKLVHSLFGR